MTGKVYPLSGPQADAVEPRDSVWLSASAGTGKTQVLSARVLRLLLQPGVSPENILCLTFTKAGAAEMATRVNEVLARWVRMKPEMLAADLIAIGADPSPESLGRARTLFASVLDCPGGGLRIDTIHAFSQWLLANFPQEAGLTPGTRPMEDRDQDVLAHRVLADLLVDWEQEGREEQLAALEFISTRMGPDKARSWLMRCARAREAWFGPGGWQEPLRERVDLLLGIPPGAGPDWAAHLCDDAQFDRAALSVCMESCMQWGTASAIKIVEGVGDWLAGDSAARAQDIGKLRKVLFTEEGKPRWLKNLEKLHPGYADDAADVLECIAAVEERVRLLALAEVLTPALTVGRRFALAWEEAKEREGLVDFDDLIRYSAALLQSEGLGPWIRYKLDRRFDHILVDEAQDTNEAQWQIIRALTEDFFTGEGQRDGRLRTIFVVGDYKQAIFRFQGTSPENFAAAKEVYRREMADRADAAAQLRDRTEARALQELGLDRSYRTAQPVLDFVDRAIAAIGPSSFGLREVPEHHVGDDRPGLVTLWAPVTSRPGADDSDEGEGEGTDQAWLPRPERDMADAIARQVKQWINTGFPLVKGQARNAQAGDILVLVRKRRELAGLIVARLHAAGVPVAGVDRLRLGAPLAVKDLMAAVRFAAQPLDDLSLANLLVSPLIGWSQDQLLQHAHRAPGVHLWDHLRRSGHGDVAGLRLLLDPLLARADFEPPHALLRWLLVGPWQGRSKLVARLGREANDPVDELLNAAMAFAATNTPGLQAFIRWFDSGEGELKREAGAAGGLVRVMTVHGSKGLQAPIVILADATGNPDTSPTRDLTLADGDRHIPVPDLPQAEKVAMLADLETRTKEEERQEHWRLLYVAMTRAEEALFIGGALGKREQEPAPDSWYARLAPLMQGDPLDDAIWGQRQEWGQLPPRAAPRLQEDLALPAALPAWARRAVGPEPRPPRPLAPSAAGEDFGADPPLPAGTGVQAARRGTIIHRLLERLPELAPDVRAPAAQQWLDRHAADLPPAMREEMLARALAVLAEPGWADLFGPDALAEVPLAAVVDGQVISGTADRLMILPDRVLVADFKTARRPPQTLAEVPAHTVRQMAAYAAALGVIYPGRRIEAALLYTQTPQLIAIPADMLVRNKPALPPAQESLDRQGVVVTASDIKSHPNIRSS